MNLVVEVKGYREDAKDKANTMDAYWAPGVNDLSQYGRWAFAEFKEVVYAIAADFDALIARRRRMSGVAAVVHSAAVGRNQT